MSAATPTSPDPDQKQSPRSTSGGAGINPEGAVATPADPSATGAVVFAAKLISFCLLAALLYWGKVVAIPLSLAILLSFTLKPLVRLLQRCRLPRAVSVMVAVFLACGVLVVLGWVIGTQLAQLGANLPSHRDNIVEKVRSLRDMTRGGTMEKIQGTVESLTQELKQDQEREKSEGAPVPGPPGPAVYTPLAEQPQRPLPVVITTPQQILPLQNISALMPVVDPLATAALVLVLVILVLLRWEDLRTRIISFTGHENLTKATRACDEAGRRITRYLLIQMLLNGGHGLVFGVGLYIIGVPYAALWGLCAAIFRYLPYVGPIVGGGLPVLFSIVTAQGWEQPLWVGGLILVLETVSNNFLEPWLYGSRLGLSEVGIIMAAVAWTFLWGPVGLVLATPLTVCLVVLGHYIPAFSIFPRLLGDMPVLEQHYQLFQRLLAHDADDAASIAKKVVREVGLAASIDQLLVPCLALLERDLAAGHLAKEEEQHLAAVLGILFSKMLEEEAKRQGTTDATPAPPAPESPVEEACVLVWPVGTLAACAVPWLSWLVCGNRCRIETLGSDVLSAEAAAKVRETRPAALCLLSLSHTPTRLERQLAKRIRQEAPELPIIAARLGGQTPAAPPATRPEPGGAQTVTHTMSQTSAAIRPLAQAAALGDGAAR